MLVLDQVSDEFLAGVCVELIGRIGHTGAIRDELLGIVDTLLLEFLSRLAKGYKSNIHSLIFPSILSVSGWISSATAAISTTKSRSRI